MKRKIIKQGHNTLTVTLPSEWAKRFNLGSGVEVDLVEKDNGLFICTESQGDIKRASFDISNMDIPTIWKYFMAVYREGYDEVLVKFDSIKEMESPYKYITHNRLDLKYNKSQQKKNIFYVLMEFVNRFIGYEIIERGKDSILVKDLSQISGKEFDNALRRVFLIFQGMAEDAIAVIKSKDVDVLRNMHDVDISLDKFHDYCIRILNKRCNKDSRKTNLYFSTLYLLELAADEFKNISLHLIDDFPNSNLKNLIPFIELVKEEVDAYLDVFYNYSLEKINKITEIDKKTYLEMPKVYNKVKTTEEHELLHHFRIIRKYINALTEIRIEMEF